MAENRFREVGNDEVEMEREKTKFKIRKDTNWLGQEGITMKVDEM